MKTKQTQTDACPNCEQWQNWTEKGYYDCFHDCAERGFAPKRPTPAYTTVWTNHGEPQEIDEKYGPDPYDEKYSPKEMAERELAMSLPAASRNPEHRRKVFARHGVALQAKSEADATRQAELETAISERNKSREDFSHAAQQIKILKAQRDEWKAIAKKEASNCNELERENDELLAALEQFAKCNLNEGNCASLEVANRRIRNIARAAIANAKKPDWGSFGKEVAKLIKKPC